jgi:signal transduction histidine kinase
VVALALIAVLGSIIAKSLGGASENILKDNYRSVLAAQRMKEYIERIDSAAAFIVLGERERALNQTEESRSRFEEELRIQEGNITEAGEAEATQHLRQLWIEYQAKFDRFLLLKDKAELRDRYFAELRPAFEETRQTADVILALNQDAMVRKTDEAVRLAARFRTLLILVAVAGALLGMGATMSLTGRLLRPLAVLSLTARRIGTGDLQARARVRGKDEIALLARELNSMADQLRRYRESSLGELLEAQQASQAAIDSLPDPVLVLSVQGELIHLNRAAEAQLKLSLERHGANLIPHLDPALRPVIDHARQHVISGKGALVSRSLDEAIRVSTPEGEKYFLARGMPMHGEGGSVTGVTIVLQDVTRLLRFDELKNSLVATVAHEFRTPLTSLRMAIHLITEEVAGPLTDKQSELLHAAREDCERLQSIVDELLDLSRIQAGRIDLKRAPLEIEAVVLQAIEAHRSQAAQNHVRLRSEVLPGTGQILADADRLQLVFANLISNAIRYGSAGGEVSLRARVSDGAVRFEVSDRGPGIPREYQQAVFEKYFRMPGTTSGGAGLGLFIAKEIVEAHGGRIGIDSSPGQGSTFWFTLPLASEELSAAA